ncbi:MAG TPA: inositol monophosphatase family protein [Pseudonocardiaceae bacterium]|nr:inositol monophosphatase family protein [Pseudonocardiaceae bacterium]
MLPRSITAPADARVDIEAARSLAVRAAESAGALIRADLAIGTDGGAGNGVDIRAKGDAGDLVTNLDIAAERRIVKRIRGGFPDHRILTEEAGLLDAADDDWLWLVDPLDGTNNVAIGLHAYVVGIALCHHGVPVVGVVHDPIAGHTWSAVRGRGALGPTGPFTRTRRRPAGDPVIAWVQGYGVARRDETARSIRLGLESGARRVLQLWAPLLCWVMLARGDIDGFVGYRAGIVDLPAGALIAREAGITIYDFDGSPFDDGVGRPEDDQHLDFVAGPPDTVSDLLVMVKAAGDPADGGSAGGQ